MFISGMGFFTDAYDLFIIGVVMSIVKHQWHVTPTADAALVSLLGLAATNFMLPEIKGLSLEELNTRSA